MKRLCRGKTKTGQPCSAPAGASGYCMFHDPALGRKRAAGRKRGGERHRTPHAGNTDNLPKSVRTLDDVLAVLDYALAEAIPLENSVPRGRLLVSLSQAFIEAIKVGEFEQRIAALESRLNDGSGNPAKTA